MAGRCSCFGSSIKLYKKCKKVAPSGLVLCEHRSEKKSVKSVKSVKNFTNFRNTKPFYSRITESKPILEVYPTIADHL